MSEIVFSYNGIEIVIPCSIDEKFGPIIDRFCLKAQLSRKNVYFLFAGQILDEEIKEGQVEKNENNQKIILVCDYNRNSTYEDVLINSKEIICPKCKKGACISMNNYKICIDNCSNGHKTDNISINDFKNTQNINLSSIICNICKIKNKGNVINNEFFRCITCKYNLCPICKASHSKDHCIINYDYKNCLCEEHGEVFVSYCKFCKKDICMSCDEQHEGHEIEFYQRMKHNKEQIKENAINLKNNIDKLNQVINGYIENLNKVKNFFANYYDIIDNIFKTINSKYRNYNKLYNINFIINNALNKDIQNIMNEPNINNKLLKLLKIYEESEKKLIEVNKDNNINRDKDQNKINEKEFPEKHENRRRGPIIHNSMKELLDELLRDNWVTSQKVYISMMAVDRADFAPTNPYQNYSQPIPCDKTISSPLLHGYCLELLKDYLTEGNTVLDVGFGSGYLTVAMSKMMNDKGCVVGIEINKNLYDFGKNNILKHHKKLIDSKNIELILGDAKKGYAQKAPYKCIHVGVSALEPPKILLEQLAVGGRLIMPLGERGDQFIYAIDKIKNNKIVYSKGLSVCYGPLI